MPSSVSTTVSVKGIDHITIVVEDLERSRKFYTEILGMQEVERPDFGFPGLWFQAGSSQIHLNVAGQEAGQAGLPCLGAKLPSRGFHYAFEIDDCDAAAPRLTALGFEIVTGPKSRPDGARQLYIYDPDGHLVELFSLPK